MATTSVACKLPHGLQVEHADKIVTLLGANADDAVCGFGITRNVDADWFAEWSTVNADFGPLKRGLIFANAKEDSLKAEAREKSGERTGLEGLDAANPSEGIEPTEETKKTVSANSRGK